MFVIRVLAAYFLLKTQVEGGNYTLRKYAHEYFTHNNHGKDHLACEKELIGIHYGDVDDQGKNLYYEKYHKLYWCLDLCWLQKQGMVRQNGSYSIDAYTSYAKKRLPQETADKLVTFVAICAKEHDDSFAQDKDCEKVSDFLHCEMLVIHMMYGWEPEETDQSNEQE